jgi:spore maturation protein CgeB
MKILSCCPRGYYGKATGTAYEYHAFVDEPRAMGHTVHHFDYWHAGLFNREGMNDFFLSIVRNGGYDLVIVMLHDDEFRPEALDEARRHSVLMAWNCDDDWRWDDYSSRWASHFTYMVTTYRSVYEANKARYPNLLLSQWGCTSMFDGQGRDKDLDFTFVGKVHADRKRQIELLRKKAGLVAFGQGVEPQAGAVMKWTRRFAWHVLRLRWQDESSELPHHAAVKDVWNRTRVSFTPLEASGRDVMQVKARVFDMGMSGSVMLCSKNPLLYEFYQPGAQFVEFETMDECVEKARWLLANESERSRIAERYRRRTLTDHMWRNRYDRLFKSMGLSPKDAP